MKYEPEFFLGTCDVCGKAIAYKHDMDRAIDVLPLGDGRVATWIRHYATAPSNANPDCAKYSSRVYQVETPPELLTGVDKNEEAQSTNGQK